MSVLEKMRENRNTLTKVLVLICMGLVVAGGVYYVNSLHTDLTNQAISNVLRMTQQQQQAFDTFMSGDRERMHSFAHYFSRTNSSDAQDIQEKLEAFSDVDAFYSVINLDTGVYYNNRMAQAHQMTEENLQTYRAFSGSDVRNPYVNLSTSTVMFGYYECFTFADGVPGVFQKGYECAKVSEEFSLSFYSGQGLGYVVNKEGEILVRSVDKIGRYSFDNIFDMVVQSGSSQDSVNSFIDSVNGRETGAIVLSGEEQDYVYAYVPLQNVEDWYLISIVPLSAVTQEADEIIMDSKAVFLIFLVVMIVFLAFLWLMWQSQQDLAKKDLEIEYRQRQFEILSTYLSNNTDDIYLMLDAKDQTVEFISPNVERVLGISETDVLRDVRTIGRANYISEKSVELSTLAEMNPGESMCAMLTERVNTRTRERKWFRETVYCVSVQNRNKIVVYISDRTKERQVQDTLAQALDTAQVANKAKTAFLGSVSHDIRTPMNAIMGLTMLLQEEANDPERVMEYTQRIDAASQHLLGLINDVLDMNKIEGGNTTLNISELNLAEIIDELNTIIRPQARAKNQEFKIYASSFTYEHLLGDKLRINQVLINILSNAVKYTQAGGKIEMFVNELPQVRKDYSHVQFIVRDNGQGMSEDYLKVIFDPFTREENASTRKIQGTGLGMAITKNLMDLMGGTIKVESEVGKGSTFTLELELGIQEMEDDLDFWKNNGVLRMIVADDEEEICLNVVKAMSKTGVTVHYATNGQTAVDMMRTAREKKEPYDLILLDWKMPDLDGLETARLIRKNYPAKIPIFFFTAYDWQDIEEEAMEIGVNHFLPKPFFISSFKQAISRVIGDQGQTTTALEQMDAVVQGKHILVVDDVEVNRMILVKILDTLGATCDIADNGQTAVETFTACQPGKYDLILMDVQMPVMDGYAATRAIRDSGHPDASSIAIIAMTANAFVDDIQDALAAGMDAHVSKPIVLDRLKATIQDVLCQKEQQHPSLTSTEG